MGEHVHGFGAGEQPGVPEDAERTGQPIHELVAFVQDELAAGVPLLLDEVLDPIPEVLEDVVLPEPQRLLVGDLVDVAGGLGALPQPPADREAVLVEGARDLVHLRREAEAREMDHGGGAQAGADVRGTGGQVAEPLGEGQRQRGRQGVVELLRQVPGTAQVPARPEHLHAQVVLLVDHDGASLVPADDGRAGLARGQLLRDEVTLDEHRAVEIGLLRHAEHMPAPEAREVDQRGDAPLRDLLALRGLGPARERMAGEIAGQADAGAEHHRLGAGGAGRVPVVGEDLLDGHGQAGLRASSRAATSSRHRAADS